MKPFRFGINVRDASTRAEWQDKARTVEDLGYSVLLVPDHLAAMLATLPAVMSAADATTSLRVGTNVLNNDLRHPVLLAREAATMDVLTDGRLELGLGAGYMRVEYDQVGLRFDRGGIRVERLAESVPIIKGLLSGAEVNFAGQHYPSPATRSILFPSSGRIRRSSSEAMAFASSRWRRARPIP